MNTTNARKRMRAGDLQRRLQIGLVLTVVLVTGVIVTAAVIKASRVRHDVFATLIMRATELAGEEVRKFFAPMTSNLRVLQRQALTADVQALSVRQVAGQFIPVLEEFPQLSAAILADQDGREFFVHREGTAWLTRTVDATRRPGVVEWQRWADLSGPVQAWSEEFDYDPRLRPWFKGATAPQQAGEIFWTAPYTFRTAKESGVTAAVSWTTGGDHHKVFVVAFDVLLEQILHRTASIRVSENGKAFLFDARGRLIESPGEPPVSDGSPLATAVSGALELWRTRPELRTRVTPIGGGTRTHWIGYQPVAVGKGEFWIGVVVPQQDLQSEIRTRRYWLWGSAAVTLLIGTVLATLIARYYGRHLRSLERRQSPRGDSESEIRALIAQGESDRLEFKSTLRFNLKANRAGKEIELAWLKGVVAFLNTDGGVVLIGVADDGTIVGLEHDGFASEDRCLLHFNNLVNQHVGQEFAQYVSPRVRSVQGKRILLVECDPSSEPAFLRTKQDEVFYVRTGPRNAKLPVSKVLKYVQTRQSGS